jgi:hypothetical protein
LERQVTFVLGVALVVGAAWTALATVRAVFGQSRWQAPTPPRDEPDYARKEQAAWS